MAVLWTKKGTHVCVVCSFSRGYKKPSVPERLEVWDSGRSWMFFVRFFCRFFSRSWPSWFATKAHLQWLQWLSCVVVISTCWNQSCLEELTVAYNLQLVLCSCMFGLEVIKSEVSTLEDVTILQKWCVRIVDGFTHSFAGIQPPGWSISCVG